MILHIETATHVCSVALANGQKLIAFKESSEANAHSVVLMCMINDLLKEANITYADLEAVAVSKGPGSYTGLRIGVSAAKGLCYALEIPLISVNALEAIAEGARLKYKNTSLFFCPMIDARRMEVYAAIFDNEKCIRETQADIVDKDTYSEFLNQKQVVFVGDGALKCKEVLIQYNNALFDDSILASAAFMINIAYNKFKDKEFENVAYFEPFYLKEFIAGKPVVKGLR